MAPWLLGHCLAAAAAEPPPAPCCSSRWQVKFATGDSSNGTLIVDGAPHALLQFHYHAPSEHTVNGVQYPLEVRTLRRPPPLP